MNLKSLVLLSSIIFSGFFMYEEPARAEDACVLTTDGNTVCGKLIKQQSVKQQSTKPQEFKINNYVFVMKECKRYPGSSLVGCEITITNKGATRDLKIIATSQRNPALISTTDSLGDKYSAKGSMVQIGGRSGSNIDVTLAAGKSYELTLVFDGVALSC
jgi:hypothetical protein